MAVLQEILKVPMAYIAVFCEIQGFDSRQDRVLSVCALNSDGESCMLGNALLQCYNEVGLM